MQNSYSLFMATNYVGTQNELGGCIRDWKRMLDRARRLGIPEENIISLIDKNYRIPFVAAAVKHLLSIMKSGDKLFGANSGHGIPVQDQNGDEPDGKDEAIVTNDFQLIVDDEIYKNLCLFPAGSLVVACFDNCHAGTMDRALDMKNWHYMQSGVKANSVLYFGCAEESTSADAFIQKERQGAFTYCWNKALDDFNSKLTYLQLLDATNSNLRKLGFSQVTKMACTPGMENKLFWTM